MRKNMVFHFFDKLEDHTRASLSKVPIIYALIGGIGIVLFWRGVWHTADLLIPLLYTNVSNDFLFKVQLLDTSLTLFVSIIILLITGLLVTNFIGNRIIISGIKHEKKLEEKEAEEIESEEYILHTIHTEMRKMQKDIDQIKNKVG